MLFFAPLLGIAAYRVELTRAAALSTVTLDYGTFTGYTDTTNGLIYFRGIRYADPPVGDLRWQAPVSPPSSDLGDVDASEFGFACIDATQTNSGATTDEDCLFLNVYVPIATTETDALPVLVFFHGGGFESGRTSEYPPENIVLSSAEPLIFVTVDYRLGQFGFLGGTAVHDNGDLNAGLLDQKAALEWVQEYVDQFSGNPNQVTIWGQSAGAGSVVYHLIGDGGTNTDLFSQAMGDSPPFLYLPNYTDTFVEDLFTQFASLAGCGGQSSDEDTMDCLRSASTKHLATAGSKTLANLTSSLYPFGPVTDDSYIQERPVDAFTNGNFVRVPLLFGSNTDEGANWSAELPNPSANTSSPHATETTVYNFLAGQFNTLTSASFQEAVAQYYPLADYGGSLSLQGQQMYGEMRYICSAVMITGVAYDAWDLTTYQYRWDNPTLGSTHGDELVAFFNETIVFDAADAQLAATMRQYWTSFVTSGTPVSNVTGAIVWPAVDDADGSSRILLHPGNVSIETVSDDLSARCDFWHGLASELYT
ncbi:Alpha/Beta hydrolase protein [Mycena maculata]|uniref:Alpha/Beta hydrolase protein n=1 Tax=Mycena maculata TaxID=230809 RepID=A0AAD7MX29_9AGAR|nr:Alpha/Beta hydrolase protein [Mycena maculata]